MYFDTGQRTELRQIARIDLTPRTPQFREDQFRDLFREEPVRPPRPADPPKDARAARGAGWRRARRRRATPVTVVFDDIRQRLSLLPTGIDAGSQRLSPDGKTLLIIGRAAGQQNLYTFSIDELAREPAVARQLTSTAGAKSDAEFTPDGKEVFFLEQGRITVITVENRKSRRLSRSRAEMDVDFAAEKMQVFQQAWSYLRDSFFDPRFNGVDWQAVRAQYAPLVAGAATRDEMRRLLSLMVGELNASHLGVNAPAAGGPVVGKLGLRFDRREYEQNGRFKVTEVIALTPAAIGGVRAGDYLLAVNGTTLDARVSLEQVLSHTINRRVDLVVSADAAGTNRRDPRRTADQPGDREEPGVPAVGREEPRLRRQVRATAGSATSTCSTCRTRPSTSSTWTSMPRITRATASSSTSGTTTAASSTCTRSTCSRGRTT